MRCRHFFSFALVVFLSFFFGSFIITSDTFATSQTITFNTGSYSRNQSVSFSTLGFDGSFPIYSFDFAIDYGQGGVFSCSSYMRLGSNSSLFYLKSNNSSSLSSSGGILHLYYSSIIPFSSSDVLYFLSSSSSCSIGSFDVSLTLYDSLLEFSSPPSGNIDITSNGTYDVTSYAQATVNVSAEVIQGDYHDDLISINNSILVCGAILLVLYFFYCIYRLIIKNSGVH